MKKLIFLILVLFLSWSCSYYSEHQEKQLLKLRSEQIFEPRDFENTTLAEDWGPGRKYMVTCRSCKARDWDSYYFITVDNNNKILSILVK
jgi:hypothetical protein